MNTSVSTHLSFSPRAWAILLLGVAALWSVGCTTIPPEQDGLRRNFMPHWTTNEVPYEEAGSMEKVGINVREGLVGILDDLFEGAFSLAQIGPTTGYAVQKAGTVVGDVIGLIDDNEVTEHVFEGIVSKQFLKFGASAQGFAGRIGAIHERNDLEVFDEEEGRPAPNLIDYIGANKTFHTKAYGRPSALATAGAVVIADFLIRPAGNLIKIFGGRGAQETMEGWAFDLIAAGMRVNFY